MTPIIEAEGLSKSFPMPSGNVDALRGLDLTIDAGEYLSVTGPSGCGKSTLLHLLGIVDVPTAGTLMFEGHDPRGWSDAERSRLRLTKIGFVFQRFYLLPMLTASENVALPMAEAGVAKSERRERAAELLDYVGLGERLGHTPAQLSGGEMQRVAIARALANRPRLLLADEPTGELDEKTGRQIASLLDRVNADGTTVVVVTHDPSLADRAGRRLRLAAGRVVEGEADR